MLPKSYIFEATQACNHDCPHCYNVWKNDRPYPAGQLGTAETLSLLDRLIDQSGAEHLTFTGGEPLLRDDLDELIAHVVGRGLSVNLISNGRLLTPQRITQLRPMVSVFELPLLSSVASIHDQMSGNAGAFDAVTLAIAELKAVRGRVVCVFVATQLNIATWPETARLAFALGADGIMFNRFNPGGRGREHIEELQLGPNQLKPALAFADQFAREHEFPISCSIAMPPCLFDHAMYPNLSFGTCAAGTERAYYTIDPLGNLRPCNHSPTILGNLRRDPLDAMLAGETMCDFAAARPSFCGGCVHERSCQGGCKAAAEVCCGDVGARDPFLSAYGCLAAPAER